MSNDKVNITEEIRKKSFRAAVVKAIESSTKVMDDEDGYCIVVDGKRVKTLKGKHSWGKEHHAKAALYRAVEHTSMTNIMKLIDESGKPDHYSCKGIHMDTLKELYHTGFIKIVKIKDFAGNS